MIDLVPRGTISGAQPVSVMDAASPSEDRCALITLPETAASASRAIEVADTRTDHCDVVTAPALSLNPNQPIADVPAYLKSRRPVPHYHGAEHRLFVTLPEALQVEVHALLGFSLGGGAFGLVQTHVKSRLSVQSACRKAIGAYGHRWKLKTFREKFDLWLAKKDWLVLVNKTKAGAKWQEGPARGLPDVFVTFCASRFGGAKRDDAKLQAHAAILRQWRTGRDRIGDRVPIPGYGFWQDWAKSQYGKATACLMEEAPIPSGWDYSNILRVVKARQALPKAVEKLLHEGTAAAREYLPHVHGTRSLLRFMERIMFDDLKTDWRILDPDSGQVCDLWLLIARDLATNLLLGFGLRPARARDDGSQEHLKATDMKQLLGWLLEHFGLPPYLMHWVFERGTATVAAAMAAAYRELLGEDRVACHWTSMIGGVSPAGYAERKVGNSQGKASLESCNRLTHTMLAGLPGQVGRIYTRRPSDISAREKEAVTIWKFAQLLPAHLRGSVEYPLLTLEQARVELTRIFHLQNTRTDHALEGFATVLKWLDPVSGKWLPQNTAPCPLPIDPKTGKPARVEKFKESPVERAARLVAGLQWTAVPPRVIAASYEHTVRSVVVNKKGQIICSLDGSDLTFIAAQSAPLAPGTKALAYSHPHDPRFLHLTDGKGSFLGTWLRLNRADDQESLAAQIAYCQGALNAARAAAEQLAAPERAELAAMRARNAELLAAHTFIEVAPALPHSGTPTLTSPVANALAHGPAAVRASVKHRADLKQIDSL